MALVNMKWERQIGEQEEWSVLMTRKNIVMYLGIWLELLTILVALEKCKALSHIHLNTCLHDSLMHVSRCILRKALLALLWSFAGTISCVNCCSHHSWGVSVQWIKQTCVTVVAITPSLGDRGGKGWFAFKSSCTAYQNISKVTRRVKNLWQNRKSWQKNQVWSDALPEQLKAQMTLSRVHLGCTSELPTPL